MQKPIPLSNELPPYLTTDQAATYCGLSASFFNKARLEGRGPPYCRPPGCRRVLYARVALDAWMASGMCNMPEASND